MKTKINEIYTALASINATQQALIYISLDEASILDNFIQGLDDQALTDDQQLIKQYIVNAFNSFPVEVNI
jgi:hypothetical protein